MKQQATHYLGLEVHQATTVATCRNESGTVVLKATVPTEAEAIVRLVSGAPFAATDETLAGGELQTA